MMMGTLSCLLTNEDARACFSAVKSGLAPDGLLVLELDDLDASFDGAWTGPDMWPVQHQVRALGWLRALGECRGVRGCEHAPEAMRSRCACFGGLCVGAGLRSGGCWSSGPAARLAAQGHLPNQVQAILPRDGILPAGDLELTLAGYLAHAAPHAAC